MLWLCLSFPNLAIELRGSAEEGALAITDRLRGRRVLIACNSAAQSQGIHPGQDAISALAREPNLQLVDRSVAGEVRALSALAAWAMQYSADVCTDDARWLLWLEIGGSLAYFNGLQTLLANVSEGLKALGYDARHGVAPTLEAAALLARDRGSQFVEDVEHLPLVIGALPLTRLALPMSVIEHLKASGLHLIQEVRAIPAASLARRFGTQIPDYLQRLFGALPDPRPHYRVQDRYRRVFDCSYPVESVEGLLFPLRRLLQELAGFLRGRDVAIQALSITLRHRGSSPTEFEIRSTTPQRDAVRWFELLRERLERIQLPEAVTEIRLGAEHLLAPNILQTDLFDEGIRKDAGWIALLDKLRARLGDAAVRGLGLADDHRPEMAWVEEAGPDAPLPESHPHRPLWILEPRPIEHLPKLCGLPERIEAGWWDGEDCSRDYYLARTEEGARWWLFKDARTQRWFLHGIWG